MFRGYALACDILWVLSGTREGIRHAVKSVIPHPSEALPFCMAICISYHSFQHLVVVEISCSAPPCNSAGLSLWKEDRIAHWQVKIDAVKSHQQQATTVCASSKQIQRLVLSGLDVGSLRGSTSAWLLSAKVFEAQAIGLVARLTLLVAHNRCTWHLTDKTWPHSDGMHA